MKAREKVIIVGGGPVGLLCALNLASHDVPVLVLESHPELFMDLRAGSFHPPTLEVMEPLGLTAKLLDIGIPVHKWQLRDRNKGIIATFELSLLGDETPFPFRLHLEQHRFTPIVLEELRKLPNAEVRFSSHVENIAQTDSGEPDHGRIVLIPGGVFEIGDHAGARPGFHRFKLIVNCRGLPVDLRAVLPQTATTT